MKTFVVAGTRDQAESWIKNDIMTKGRDGSWRSRSDYIYVDGTDRLRGFSNPHGVFIGTWRERKDILQIVEMLIIQSVMHSTIQSATGNAVLRQIYQELK